MKFVYIAGPYRGGTRQEIDGHIYMAARALRRLARLGIGAFCPHLNSAHFEYYTADVPASYWLDLDLHFLEACDAILLLTGWRSSGGTIAERVRAIEMRIPIFEDTNNGWKGLERWANR